MDIRVPSGWITLYQIHIERGLYDMSLEKGKAEALQRVIDELRDEPGALMPIMQRAQDIFAICRRRFSSISQRKWISGQRCIRRSDVLCAV